MTGIETGGKPNRDALEQEGLKKSMPPSGGWRRLRLLLMPGRQSQSTIAIENG